MRIIILILIAFGGTIGCSDIEQQEVSERLVSNEDVVATMRAYLNIQNGSNKAIVSNPELLLTDVDLTTIQDHCGITIDTSLQLGFQDSDFGISFASNLALSLECNELGFPSQINFDESSTGNYSTSNSFSTFEQISAFEAVLDLHELQVDVSGITGHTGSLTIIKNEDNLELETSLRFDLENLQFDILQQQVAGGSATAVIGFSNGAIKEEYIANINYLANAVVQINLNDKAYEINLGYN